MLHPSPKPRALAPTSLSATGRAGAALVGLCLVAGCATLGLSGSKLRFDERPYLDDLEQLTFGGENAEAYWSFTGDALSLQIRRPDDGCDRIYRLPMTPSPGKPIQVSSGKGATTCAHFFPDGDLLYASTHLGGEACPPKPDMRQGYVWALYDSYDIFTTNRTGEAPTRITQTPGYDAEGTVCAVDGSIVFTSVRDGDLELYRMDKDGGNVRRLTNAAGYDGGAFFNGDCSKIVWRASRPRPGKELDDYKALLAQGLVRPSKLEIWIANADGSEAMQLTYLDAASFAPAFHPTDPIILFSSNHGDPQGREFEIWGMRTDGSGLRRITHSPGFDGFPHFSPDGTRLAFSSNRATAEGANDTNVFVARWKGLPPLEGEAVGPAGRIREDITWLAAPEREGRGLGTKGLDAAGAYLEERLGAIGLLPAGDGKSFRMSFPVVTAVDIEPGSQVVLGGRTLGKDDYAALGFSAEGQVSGELVLAGYGIVSRGHELDDYAHLDVEGKIVLVRRFAPDEPRTRDAETRRRLGDLRHKAWLARERGAAALLVVDWPLPPKPAPPDWKLPAEEPLRAPHPEGFGDAGLPVLIVKREAIEPLMPMLLAQKPVKASLDVDLVQEKSEAFNVVGRIPAGAKAGGAAAPRAILLGAHYDHLGMGGRFSLAPDSREPHVGADDNASGTAVLLELARALHARRADLTHDVLIAFFSGEESGLLGSAAYARVKSEETKRLKAMLNFDMVGRLRGNRLDVLGTESATEWAEVVRAACGEVRLDCNPTGDGQGPSDQASFYTVGVPVLHLFTGAHTDYHKPSDRPNKINAAGAAAIASLGENLVMALNNGITLSYQQGKTRPPGGDRRGFRVSLGTIPDYAGPPEGQPGVLLAGVREGSAADQAGMQRGDILRRLGRHEIRSVEDFMYALQGFKPGEKTTAVVLRGGKEVKVEPVFQEARAGAR